MMQWQGGTSWYNRWTPEQWRGWLKEPKDKESIDEEESDDELRWDGSSYGEPICQHDEVIFLLALVGHFWCPGASGSSETIFSDNKLTASHRHRRTFWVEDDGTWGWFALPDDQQEVTVQEDHWVGNSLPPEVCHPHDKTRIEEDDEEIYWSGNVDGYHGYVRQNYCQWFEADGLWQLLDVRDGRLWRPHGPSRRRSWMRPTRPYETKARTLSACQRPITWLVSYPMKKGKKGKGKGQRIISTSRARWCSYFFYYLFIYVEFKLQRRMPTNLERAPPSWWRAWTLRAWSSWWRKTTRCLFYKFQLRLVLVCSMWAQPRLFGLRKPLTRFYNVDINMDIFIPENMTKIVSCPRPKSWFALEMVRWSKARTIFYFHYMLAPRRSSWASTPSWLRRCRLRALTKLGAIVDGTGGWLLLTNVDAKIRILRQKNAAVHLLVDLTDDWLAQGQPMASAGGRV